MNEIKDGYESHYMHIAGPSYNWNAQVQTAENALIIKIKEKVQQINAPIALTSSMVLPKWNTKQLSEMVLK